MSESAPTVDELRSPYVIYSLRDERGLPLYIGSTKQSSLRFKTHRKAKGNSKLAQWIRDSDKDPDFTVIALCETETEMHEVEGELIRSLKPKLNTRMCNGGIIGERRLIKLGIKKKQPIN